MPHKLLPACIAVVAILVAVWASPVHAQSIEHRSFGTTAAGEAVEQYTLKIQGGSSVSILTYGGTITNIIVPDEHDHLADVVLGFDNLKQYETQSPYFGAIIGRVANRIAHGTFTLDGQTYHIPINDGPNALHGGKRGYDKRIWSAQPQMTPDGPSLHLSLVDPDGSEGFPGTVHVGVVYTFTNEKTLRIEYTATTDKPTPINLTNHSYFNLKDDGRTNVLGHVLQINADHYTPTNASLIPTGEIADVKNTPFDFTTPKPIGKDISAVGGDPSGYDQNFVLNNPGGMRQAAIVFEPTTGRLMTVNTTQPGIQFYTGNFLDGSIKGKDGIVYHPHSAFCLETQDFPDAINQPNFPTCVLKPGQTYHQVTEYIFATATQFPR